MKIYNTLTRTIEEFIPREEGKVKFYKAGKGKKVKITVMTTDGSNKKKTVSIKIK